jgi:primosomal protein N' (replication factor Y)
MFVDVALPITVNQTFTYRLTDGTSVRVGARVVVPFGRKLLTGYVVGFRETLPPELATITIKPITKLVDEESLLTDEILNLTRWISDYYFAPWGEVIRAALPSGLSMASEKVISITAAGRAALEKMTPARLKLSTRAQALDMLTQADSLSLSHLDKKFGKVRTKAIIRELERRGHIRTEYAIAGQHVKPKTQKFVALGAFDPASRLSPPAARTIDTLSHAGQPIPLKELTEQAKVSASTIRTLERRGVIKVFSQQVRRDPFARHGPISPPEWFALTSEQAEALKQIEQTLDEGKYATFLLHGVTGSGKTEVYIRAMHSVLRRGKTALMLVPEIALTPVFSRRLVSHFGEAVAILHSSLSEGERFDEWHRIARGEARIVIGTRSAVFAPLANLGLVVVDEEHDTSYKQDDSPRYHGRDTAIVRAHEQQALVILGSATPSMESFHNTHIGKYAYVQLGERIGGRRLAEVRLVDMRQVFTRHGKQVVFSDELLEAMKETYERGEQAIILLNRRGFSSFVLCRRCGLTMRCPNCDVSLTYHRSVERLICHYCNHQSPVLARCPSCDGEYIFFAGVGTEQLEARLKRIFPTMAIARLDRDTARRRGVYDQIITEFAAGSIHTLIGTQMIAKGHDFPNVTLVGVVSVDAVLGLPDFRAAERTFQLLTQVAGRAGRGDVPGRVIIQTYYPEHYTLKYAEAQDYEGFYQREINFRRALHYPPLTTLIQVIVHHRQFEKANLLANELARHLRQADGSGQMRLLGPAPAPLARLRGEHRLQIILKSRHRPAAHQTLQTAMEKLRQADLDTHAISIDVDPVDLM